MEVPFIGGSYTGRDVQVNAQQTINWFAELDNKGGKSIMKLVPTPGLLEFCDPSVTAEVRGMMTVGDYLYEVIGNTLYKITSAGVMTAVTGTLTTSTGIVYMMEDGRYLTVIDPGVDGYVYDTVGGGNLTAIADADFPTPSSGTWQDGYAIVGSNNTGRFYVPTLYLPTEWDALDYATAEANPDNLSRVFSYLQNLWLLGEETSEVWYNSGAADFPFTRYSGAVVPYGIHAPDSIAGIGGLLFWMTHTRQIVQAAGFSPKIISDASLEYHLSRHTTVSDARAFCYAQEGHSFYVLTLPSGNQTWVYDPETTLWHERRSYPVLADGSQGRHRANCYAFFANKHLIGDYQNGKTYEMDPATGTDDGEMIRRERITQFYGKGEKRIAFRSLNLQVAAGVGTITGAGSDPHIGMQYSDDGGKTWSNELWRSIGKIGQFNQVVKWFKLGSASSRAFRLAYTDPVRCVITNAHLDVKAGG